jgi:hypothetical protein
MEGKQLDAPIIDLDVKFVDIGVSAQDPVDKGQVAIDDPLDRQLQAILCEAAHLEQPSLQLIEFFLKVPAD